MRALGCSPRPCSLSGALTSSYNTGCRDMLIHRRRPPRRGAARAGGTRPTSSHLLLTFFQVNYTSPLTASSLREARVNRIRFYN